MGDASNDKETTIPPESSVRFVVTGFGPFQSVKTNPTSIMSEKLLDYLKNHEEKPVQSLGSRTTTAVIETSAEAVRAYLDGLLFQEEESAAAAESEAATPTVVLLHMGVNYVGKGFQLERCAYNDATFRIPDEKGFQPTKERVVDGLEWDKTLATPLDVEGLCAKLHTKYPGSDRAVVEQEKKNVEKAEKRKEEGKEESNEGPSSKRQKMDPGGEKRESVEATTNEAKETEKDTAAIRIFPSTDPGRYVCNYTYCYSLNKFCSEKPKKDDKKNRFYSLFLHVPPFKLVPEEDQLRFVVDLMQLIDETVSNSPPTN